MDAIVQPGLGWVEFNRLVKGKGVFFPVDPAPGASFGGMIAMSCSGTNAGRYGTMKEWVRGVTVVLADGRVVKTGGRARKSAAGYDLTGLIVGSEGTLGVVTEAVVRLAPLPKNLQVGIITLPSFDAGVAVVVELQKSGHVLEALELADGEQMAALIQSKLSPHPFTPQPTLFVKFAGPSEALVSDQIALLTRLCREQNALSIHITANEQEMDTLWAARKSMAPALIATKSSPDDIFIHSDCAVPISHLPALVSGTREIISAAIPPGARWFHANVAHAADGNVHSSIICPAADKSKVEAVLKEVARLAIKLEGTVTGEHGVGEKLREMLVEEIGREGVDIMRAIKRSVDPRGILGPGKVFEMDGEEDGEGVGDGDRERRAKL